MIPYEVFRTLGKHKVVFATFDNIFKYILFWENDLRKHKIRPNKPLNRIEYQRTLNPDDKKGAYGNDKLKSMLEAAFYAYKNNDSKTFDEYLDETIGKTTRNIRPNRLNQYRQDLVELCGGNQYGDN